MTRVNLSRRTLLAAGVTLLSDVFGGASQNSGFAYPVESVSQGQHASYPVIYSTDLYYTIEDIDDYFDTAVLLNTPELDVRGIVLDNHSWPTDGDKPLEKLMAYTNRTVPYAKGLGDFAMRSNDDKALDVPDQAGVEMIIHLLEEAKQKIAIITVGSMTDVAVAYVRAPELFSRQVSAVYPVAGSVLSPEQDYNVRLDPKAFVTIMRSGLPIVWVPVDTSMWYFPAPKLLTPAKDRLTHFLMNELLYWYLRNDRRGVTPKERYYFYDLGRTMWSTPAFLHAMRHPDASQMFDLEPCRVEFDERGLMKSVQFGVLESNIQAVRSVNGPKLNDFIASRLKG